MSVATQDTAIRTGRVTRTLIYLVLVLFALFYLLPLYVMVVNSVKPLEEITGGGMMNLPQVWTLEPWVKAWSSAQIGVDPTGLAPYFWNSIKMVVPAVDPARPRNPSTAAIGIRTIWNGIKQANSISPNRIVS